MDRQQMRLLRGLFAALAAAPVADGSRLLDQTMVLYGSNLGDANVHNCDNLPILLAGGGFRHGQYVAFSRSHNTPPCDLFVTMLQRLGVATDKFASSSRTLTGLESTKA